MIVIQTITPCLWFDDQTEAAARFYTTIFADSRILNITRYGEGRGRHGSDARDEEARHRRVAAGF